MTDDPASGTTDQDKVTLAQLQNKLSESQRRCLTIYAVCEESVETSQKLHRRCIQAERKLKTMTSLFLFSVLINLVLMGFCLHFIQRSPTPSPSIYIPERMIPHIDQVG
ncbi:MAG: hypothetical protein HC851_21495 [Acaryochloris sp. RU_4_1]|nr:hypothetical protein [Acaryochloris sp. RU_4_1]NJR56739.1 hypothetical protein [Acaryochloris sp. CRU_2_0]